MVAVFKKPNIGAIPGLMKQFPFEKLAGTPLHTSFPPVASEAPSRKGNFSLSEFCKVLNQKARATICSVVDANGNTHSLPKPGKDTHVFKTENSQLFAAIRGQRIHVVKIIHTNGLTAELVNGTVRAVTSAQKAPSQKLTTLSDTERLVLPLARGGKREARDQILEEYQPHFKKMAEAFSKTHTDATEECDLLQEINVHMLAPEFFRACQPQRGKTLRDFLSEAATNIMQAYEDSTLSQLSEVVGEPEDTDNALSPETLFMFYQELVAREETVGEITDAEKSVLRAELGLS